MPNNVTDIIDRALDAAESQIEEKQEAEPAQSVSDSEPVTEPSEETEGEVEAVAETSDKPSREVPKKEGKASRDKSGKFVKSTPAPQTELSDQVATNEAVEAPVEEAPQSEPIDAPQFWSAEDKAAFAKAPPEVRAAVQRYEAQRNEWANRVANENKRGKEIEKRASEVFEPYRLKLQANGIKDPLEAADRLLAWNELFEREPKTAIADLMTKNGLSPYDFLQEQGYEELPQYNDLRIEQALQEAAEAKKAADEYKAQLEEEKQRILLSTVEQFKNGKDSSGQARKTFAEMHAPQISMAVESIQARNPNMPLDQALNHAYDFVLAETRKALGVQVTPKTVTQQVQIQKPQVQKAKAAASSVSGAPTSASLAKKPGAKSIDEALDRAEEAMGLR